MINPACTNRDGLIAVTGGNQPYLYSLNGGEYQSSPDFVNLEAGTYTVTVKDAFNCTASAEVEIEIQDENIVEESTYMPPVTAMSARISNGEPITVQWDGTTRSYTFTPKDGISMTRNSQGRFVLTTTNIEDKKWEGTYGAYFLKDDHNTFVGFYNIAVSSPCNRSKYSRTDCQATCKEGWLPIDLYNKDVLVLDELPGEYINYNEYKTAMGIGAIPQEDWRGQDAHWLTSDRENCTERWQYACWTIVRNELQNKLQPFSQIRDFYKWVRVQTQSQGHEVQWAKGADLLVEGLSAIDNLPPPLDAYVLGGDNYVKLLTELNLGIVNYSIHRWK